MQTRSIVLTAFFIACSLIGANIKVMGTIAFDSMPGFLGALFLGPAYGACIGAIGHFLTALLSGFPLSLPVHLITMISMALTMAAFGMIYRKIATVSNGDSLSIKGILLSGTTAILINGPLSLLVLSPLLLPVLGQAGIFTLLPVLSGVAALNILCAFVVYRSLPHSLKRVKD